MLYRWALRGFEVHFGLSHPDTLSVLIIYTDLTHEMYKGNILNNLKMSEVCFCSIFIYCVPVRVYLQIPEDLHFSASPVLNL